MIIPGKSGKFPAIIQNIKYVSEDNFVWYGEFQDHNGGIMLIAREGRVFGTMSIDDEHFDIIALDDQTSVILKVDSAIINEPDFCPVPKSNDSLPQLEEDANRRIATTASIEDVTVRVLFLYTPEAAATGQNMTDLAWSCIHQTNFAFDRSDVTGVHVNFAAVEPYSYVKSDNIVNDARDIVADPVAQDLRVQHDADVVIALVGDDSYGYASGAVATYGPNVSWAYGIVEVSKAVQDKKFVFAHEFGHLLGLGHVYDPWVSYDYAHGHFFQKSGKNWGTILGTDGFSSPDRKLNYSNPDVSVIDRVTGVADLRDNARLLDEQGHIVAAFLDYYWPLANNISGPSSLYSGSNVYLSASANGGTLPYNHQWWTSTDGFGYVYAGSGSSLNMAMPSSGNLWVRLNTTDGFNNEVTDYHTITNLGPCRRDCGPLPEIRIAQYDELEEPKQENSFILVYPNPVKSFINLRLPEQLAGIKIQLFDLSGKLIRDWEMIDHSTDPIQLSAKQIPRGSYLLKVFMNNHSSEVRINFE